MSLLEEKVQLFRGMWEGLNPAEDVCQQVEPFFRSASGQEPPRGASVLNNALQEGKALWGVCGVCKGSVGWVGEAGSAGRRQKEVMCVTFLLSYLSISFTRSTNATS